MRDYKHPSSEPRPDRRKTRIRLRAGLVLGIALGLLWAASVYFKREPAQHTPVATQTLVTQAPSTVAKPQQTPVKSSTAFIEQILPMPLRSEDNSVQKIERKAPIPKKKKRKRIPEAPSRAYTFYELLPQMEVKTGAELPLDAAQTALAATVSANPDAAEGAAPVGAAEDKPVKEPAPVPARQ